MSSLRDDSLVFEIDDKKMQKSLRLLNSRQSFSIAKKGMRAGLKEAVRDVRRNAPVKTGALKKSLSVQVVGDSREGTGVTGYIWPRKNFVLTSKGAKKKFQAGQTVKRGEQQHPLVYAAKVEKEQPFIRPTTNSLRTPIFNALKKHIEILLQTVK